jgi:hypothetical protein
MHLKVAYTAKKRADETRRLEELRQRQAEHERKQNRERETSGVRKGIREWQTFGVRRKTETIKHTMRMMTKADVMQIGENRAQSRR